MTNRSGVCLAAGSLVLAALAWISGPPSFDAVDGAEFALAGHRLEVAHSPGYPLFILLLRATSMITGPLYGRIRIFTCLAAGACLPAAYAALRSHGASVTSAAAAASGFLLLPPVLSQLNVIEVHGTAMLLCLLAIALRRSRAGPFLGSLAVFGGHPASALLLPLAMSRRWLSRWMALAALPASLMLYLPLRAPAATVAHYTRPATLPHAAAYYSMHSGRLQLPAAEGMLRLGESLGPVCGMALLALSVMGGRPSRAAFLSLAAAVLFLSSYRVPDYESFAWTALIPAVFLSARGMDRLAVPGASGKLVLACLLLPWGLWGIRGAWRAQDDAAPRYTRDLLSSLPPGAVLHTEGHSTFYVAYMIFNEGYRTDVVPADQLANFFFLRLARPLPSCVGGRPVFSTRAWGETAFTPSGVLFAIEPGDVDWSEYEIFSYSGRSPDAMAGDVAAEAWAMRMAQSTGTERDAAMERALELAGTDITRNRILQLRALVQ